MDIILNEYNKFDAEPLFSMRELESMCKIVHSETLSQTDSQITFKRFCSCCARNEAHELRQIHFYAIDVAKLDENGDAGDLIPVEYGLL